HSTSHRFCFGLWSCDYPDSCTTECGCDKINDKHKSPPFRGAMKPDILGKYIHEKSGSHYLELKPDGNYFLFEGSAGVIGTYEVNGSEITLFSDGSTSQARIQDGVITDADGDKWVRAKATGQATKVASKCPNCKSDLLETSKFCSNCGALVDATGEVSQISVSRKAPIAPQNLTNKTTSD